MRWSVRVHFYRRRCEGNWMDVGIIRVTLNLLSGLATNIFLFSHFFCVRFPYHRCWLYCLSLSDRRSPEFLFLIHSKPNKFIQILLMNPSKKPVMILGFFFYCVTDFYCNNIIVIIYKTLLFPSFLVSFTIFLPFAMCLLYFCRLILFSCRFVFLLRLLSLVVGSW